MKKLILVLLTLLLCVGTVSAEERVTIDPLKETSLKQTLLSLAYAAGKDLVVNGKLDGTTLPIIVNRTLEEALQALAEANNFEYLIRDNMILVGPMDGMLSKTKTFKVNYANLETLKEELSTFIDKSKLASNVEYSSITVTATPMQLQRVNDIIDQIDKPVKRIFIQAEVIEINRTEAEKIGLLYTTPTYDSSVSNWEPRYTIASEANKLTTLGKTLAKPNVTVLNGRTAKLLMGEKQPVLMNTKNGSGSDSYSTTTVEYKDVGIGFDVTPRIADKTNLITMDVKPMVSTISGWVTNSDTKAPIIATREASTIVSIQSGQTIIVGGLIKDDDLKNLSEVPWISKIPLIGSLFKHKDNSSQKSEIFICVTPTILPDPTEEVKSKAVKEPVANIEETKQETIENPVVEQKAESASSPDANSPDKSVTEAEPK